MLNYMKPKRVILKNHSDYNEAWVQDIVANDPSVLGLGELVLKDRERRQPRAGRLDLLFQDPDTYKRFEVELQLGASDESHIIRTIEYWDIERRRYPQYDHCAVLIAEDITSRFLNVISLFNGNIPIIAIQMHAYEVGENVILAFSKVLDEAELGLVGEDEDEGSVPTDRQFWEKERATSVTLGWMDQIFEWVKEENPVASLNYTKFYIGLTDGGKTNNYVTFRPKKTFLMFELKLPKSEEVDQLIDDAGLDTLDYEKRWNNYRIRVTGDEINSHSDLFRQLIKMAREFRAS